MINLRRVWAVTNRHLRQVIKDAPRLTGMFYWSFIELVIVGYMGIWVDNSADNRVALAVIAAAIGWSLVVRSSIEVAWNLLEELWAHNLVNMFAAPLTALEWIASAAVYIVISFSCLMVFLWGSTLLLFNYNILSVGWILVPLLCNYYLSGLAIGLLTASLLIYYGIRMTSYVFMLSWLFAPLSGVYYSLAVLPVWVQYVAHMLPTYYSIDVLKKIVISGEIAYFNIAIAFVLNMFYVVLTMWLFNTMFERSKQEGLARLTS